MTSGLSVKPIELLRAGIDLPFKVDQGKIVFTIPKVVDYEVAAISAA